MLLDHALAQGQPEPGAFALRLGREEGLEDPCLDLGGNAGPRVDHLEEEALALEPRPDGDPAIRVHVAHRLVRVRHEVDDHLMKLVTVGPHHRKILGQLQRDLDIVGAELVAEQLDRLLDDPIDSHLRPLGRPLACQREEVPDDAGAAVGAGGDLVGPLDERGVRGPAAKEVRLPHDDRERIVQLVSHAREERAHGRDLLALQESLRAFVDDLLERAIVALEVEVKIPRMEEVLDPQQHLQPVEGFRQEILGAGLQGALLRVAGRVGREDQDRQEHVLGNLKLPDDRDPVQMRHHQIEQDQIGLRLGVQGEHLPRIRGASDLTVADVRQHPLQEPHVRRLVVDDEDSGLGENRGPHGHLTALDRRNPRAWVASPGAHSRLEPAGDFTRSQEPHWGPQNGAISTKESPISLVPVRRSSPNRSF